MNYSDYLEDKQDFTDFVKQKLNQNAFGELEKMKKDMANEFLSMNEDEDESL